MRTRQRRMKTDYYLGKDSESDSDSEKEKISSKDKYWNGDSEKLEVKEIDGDKQAKELENFESKYLNGKKIEGYPSIYMVKDDKVVEYEAKPKMDTLTEFINSVL